VDVYRRINRLLYGSINKGYLLSTKYTPAAYRRIYNMMEKKESQATKYSLQSLINVPLAYRFEKIIEDYDPDVMICTHIFAAQLVNELKRRNKFADVPTVGIVTDYTIHPFWEDVTYIEYIEIASELLTYKATTRGIDAGRICPFGIPVSEKFSVRVSRAEACEILDISPDMRTVLVMAGSMGYGNMPTIIEQIHSFDKNIQILAVTGNNRRQYKKLVEANPSGNVRIYGYVDNVDVMMDAADCIITKPGGLTVTEAMCKSLPMILVNPIPGQEERNIEFLLNNGVALHVSKTFKINEALYYLYKCPDRLKAISERLQYISRPDAAERLADFVMGLKK
jgi:processive 1,2-diacylglycerol beta-glucosyltransferase